MYQDVEHCLNNSFVAILENFHNSVHYYECNYVIFVPDNFYNQCFIFIIFYFYLIIKVFIICSSRVFLTY